MLKLLVDFLCILTEHDHLIRRAPVFLFSQRLHGFFVLTHAEGVAGCFAVAHLRTDAYCR